MKKTLLITSDFYPAHGGIAAYWQELGRRLPTVEWVVLAPSLAKGEEDIMSAYRVYRARLSSRFLHPQWLPLMWHIFRVIRKEQVTCLVVGQILPVGIAVWLLSCIIRIPYVVSLHGMDIACTDAQPRKRWITKKILLRSAGIIVNSNFTARLVKKMYPAVTCPMKVVSPCPVHCPDEHTSNRKERVENIIFTLSRLVERKGVQDLIIAFEYVLSTHQNARLVIAGEGSFRPELEKLVQEKELAATVTFLGPVSSSEACEWYASCDIFALTPFEKNGDVEGFGIVYLEANAFGKPVLGTRTGGVPEAIIDGKTGMLADPGKPADIAEKLTYLLDHAAVRARLGVQGRERVMSEFTWDEQSRILKEFLS